MIRQAGREPVERNTVYEVINDFADGDPAEELCV
jgi:2-iminoacetate synthase ThiH